MRSASKYVALAGVVAVAVAAGCGSGVPVANTEPSPRVVGAFDLGRVPADTELDFIVGLELRQPARLQKFLDARLVTGAALLPEDFGDEFAVSARDYARFVAWL